MKTEKTDKPENALKILEEDFDYDTEDMIYRVGSKINDGDWLTEKEILKKYPNGSDILNNYIASANKIVDDTFCMHRKARVYRITSSEPPDHWLTRVEIINKYSNGSSLVEEYMNKIFDKHLEYYKQNANEVARITSLDDDGVCQSNKPKIRKCLTFYRCKNSSNGFLHDYHINGNQDLKSWVEYGKILISFNSSRKLLN